MTELDLTIRELAAWDFDHLVDRGSLSEEQLEASACRARHRLLSRPEYRMETPVCDGVSERLATALVARNRPIFESREFYGLTWKLALVDIRRLIAFQRRIGFSNEGPDRNPSALTPDEPIDTALPIDSQRKSPFYEVAFYGGRWFLRDGYHRSFQFLNQGIYLVPAVIVSAKSLSELGAIGKQFFGPEILFSDHPPMVTDFLDNDMTLCYRRAPRKSPIQITIQPMPDFALSGCCEERQ